MNINNQTVLVRGCFTGQVLNTKTKDIVITDELKGCEWAGSLLSQDEMQSTSWTECWDHAQRRC